MERTDVIKRLTPEGWDEESPAGLPKNKLNQGVEIYLTYKGKHDLRFIPARECIMLMIFGAQDRRCLQLDYGDKLDDVIEKLVSLKDEISLDSYLTHYLELQSICSVSIMAIEQFE